MNYKQNITIIPGTKRIEFTCMNCGIKKETYKSAVGGNKYCSHTCSGLARKAKTVKKRIQESLKHLNKPKETYAEHAHIEQTMLPVYCYRLNIVSASLSLVSLMLWMWLILGSSTVYGADYTPERICRSPKLHNLRATHLYTIVANELGTTYDEIDRIALMKVENQTHIENIAWAYDRDIFERSRMIITFEMLRLAQRKLQLWSDFGRD